MAALERPALPFPRPFHRPRPGRIALIAACGLVIIAALIQVNRFSRLTSTGYELNDLNRVRTEQQARNHELESNVAQLSSLARVDWEARTRLKMEPAKRKLYIEVNAPVPDRQSIPTRFLAPAQPEPVDPGEPMWRRLIELLPFS